MTRWQSTDVTVCATNSNDEISLTFKSERGLAGDVALSIGKISKIAESRLQLNRFLNVVRQQVSSGGDGYGELGYGARPVSAACIVRVV